MSTPEDYLASDGGTGVLPTTYVGDTRYIPQDNSGTVVPGASPDLTIPTMVDPGSVPDLPAIQAYTNAQQYPRKVSLVVSNAAGAGIDLSQLRITFNVMRGDYQNPNYAYIRVYNLNDDTVNRFNQKEFTQVVLQAGYPGNFGIIFRGLIAQARFGRESQLDSYVDLTAADGDEAYNFASIVLPLTAGGNYAQRAIAGFLQSMKNTQQQISAGYIPQFTGDGNVRGVTSWGCVKDELREFSKDYGMSWSIQDGQLTMIPNDAYVPGEAVVVSNQTGMIGTPEQTQNGVRVKMLLNPSVKIGQVLQIQGTINQYRFSLDQGSIASNMNLARSIKTNAQGLYYTMVANHSGDSRGNTWYTDVTCLNIDASVPLNQSVLRSSVASHVIPDYRSSSGPVNGQN